ncbi:MAG TPA: glycosyltransferase family 9 protein [Candidatus Baltobacteraceae bacterium]|jgi:ADP-heptose:LPS heptosyltransferase
MDADRFDNARESPELVEAVVRVVVGLGLYADGDVATASDMFLRATELAPDYVGAHFAYAQALLAQGQFSPGWHEFAWRKPYNGATTRLLEEITIPEWSGERMDACRLLVICDEGVGDAIMFSRYLPQVADRVGEVVLGWGQEHAALFRKIAGVSDVLISRPTFTEFDAFVMICDLPRVFGTTLETIPDQTPYLPLDTRNEQEWRERLDAKLPKGQLRVGINWAGSELHARDEQRSLAFEQLSSVLGIDGISFVSLQKVVRERDRADLAAAKNVLDVSPLLKSFADTAALIANLDLVVSVDTAVAHLAGALGAKVWLLLPQPSDWRWLLGRSDTPWYPTMRLIRQPKYGDWDSVLQETRLGLCHLAV